MYLFSEKDSMLIEFSADPVEVEVEFHKDLRISLSRQSSHVKAGGATAAEMSVRAGL